MKEEAEEKLRQKLNSRLNNDDDDDKLLLHRQLMLWNLISSLKEQKLFPQDDEIKWTSRK